MEIRALLEVIQVQRHDFLNHLQVVSGLLQLNKTERVRDYIKEVCVEYGQFGKIIHLNLPEATAALLINHNEAQKHQVEVVYNIQTTFAECLVPGDVVGMVLQEVLSQSLACLSSQEVNMRLLKIAIRSGEKKYSVQCSFPEPQEHVVLEVRARLAEINNMLAPWSSRVKFAVTSVGGEIFFTFPHREA